MDLRTSRGVDRGLVPGICVEMVEVVRVGMMTTKMANINRTKDMAVEKVVEDPVVEVSGFRFRREARWRSRRRITTPANSGCIGKSLSPICLSKLQRTSSMRLSKSSVISWKSTCKEIPSQVRQTAEVTSFSSKSKQLKTLSELWTRLSSTTGSLS